MTPELGPLVILFFGDGMVGSAVGAFTKDTTRMRVGGKREIMNN